MPENIFNTMNDIPFNKAPITGNEREVIQHVLNTGQLCGDGYYSKKCERWFEEKTNAIKTLLTPSCTAALEMAAILIDIQPGDEVIMPSYTFVSTANAFVLRGAKVVFVDIRPDTMNIDEKLIEAAITEKTKAIIPVHYAGVACEMDNIMSIALKHNIFVIEDAAQGVMSTYKGRPLGSIGHIGAFSFHETKNYTSGGEGGLLIINDERFNERAEIIREKGTNRSQFLQGVVDKYSWVDLGSSYLPSELQSAYLWGQLAAAEEINQFRLSAWHFYIETLEPLKKNGVVELPVVPECCEHNAHMFYIKVKDLNERTALLGHLKNNNINAAFHYVPLHSSHAGAKYSEFIGHDQFTTKESERLIRLPIWYGIDDFMLKSVAQAVLNFYS